MKASADNNVDVTYKMKLVIIVWQGLHRAAHLLTKRLLSYKGFNPFPNDKF